MNATKFWKHFAISIATICMFTSCIDEYDDYEEDIDGRWYLEAYESQLENKYGGTIEYYGKEFVSKHAVGYKELRFSERSSEYSITKSNDPKDDEWIGTWNEYDIHRNKLYGKYWESDMYDYSIITVNRYLLTIEKVWEDHGDYFRETFYYQRF